MSTLAALHRAVVASPEDRTVRLVYADALDETGEAGDAARAEFIRTQVELQSTPEPQRRHYELAFRCRELFGQHWLAWWDPVREAAGLPEPHRSGRRARRRRPPDWPYTHSAVHGNIAVHLADYGVRVRFDAGFPEEVQFLRLDTPEGGPELVHRWGDAMPVVRLGFASFVTPEQWARVDGPHLARLPELTFERLLPETVSAVAASPRLAAVTRLAVNPVGANLDAIAALVGGAPWICLRSLRFTGRLSPDAVRHLAIICTLTELEELELALGSPADLGGQGGQLLAGLIRVVAQAIAFAASATVRWREYGPALEAMAAAPWVRKLKRLRISGGSPGLLGMLGGRLYGTAERGADLIPDSALLALGRTAEAGGFEELVLPSLVIGPSAREELTTRLGSRVAFR